MEKTQSRKLSLQKIIEGIGCQVSGVRYQGKEKPDTCNLIPDSLITGITQDSRNVKPGYLFAALKGVNSDGADFIPMAIEKGAVAILGGVGIGDWGIPFVECKNPKLALAKLAANFYGKQPETIVAITGTNGKTSCAYFCTQLWQLLGKNSASIGTIGIATSNGLAYEATGSMTTPDPVKLHEILANLAEDGITNLAMEASSHGLDQYRLDGVKIKAAAFTNLTRDHLDYHGTMEKYLAAKLRLFEIMENGVAVINADIPEAAQIIKLCENRGHKIFSVGKNGGYIKITNITHSGLGQRIDFVIEGKHYTINTYLIGEFQAYNLLTAMALVIGCGVDIEKVITVLPQVQAVPGRMQGVSSGIRYQVSGASKNKELPETLPRIYVDYAHTPDALEKSLEVLRPYTQGKLWVIFGCGGDRDKGKRPQMGAVAARLADIVVVTDDNPRTEVAQTIRSEVIAACPNATEIGDRHQAIAYAISNMGADDILLIAGKGHEKTQIIGAEKLPFDDVEVAREILLELKK